MKAATAIYKLIDGEVKAIIVDAKEAERMILEEGWKDHPERVHDKLTAEVAKIAYPEPENIMPPPLGSDELSDKIKEPALEKPKKTKSKKEER